MKREVLSLILAVTITLFLFSLSSAQDWQELKGEHFIVYYTKEHKFAKEVLNKSEVYYKRIASELGYPRYSKFWLWENRVKIYIYPDKNSFLKATNQPDWSEGMADYINKQIISYAWNIGFLESLLPHEMAHLIFRDFVGFKGEIPLWLDEGVAQWAEKEKRNHINALMKKSFHENNLLSLDDMMKVDIKNVDTEEKVYIRSIRTKENQQGVLFLSGNNLINIYYLQSVSLVTFLIDKYGAGNFAEFCRELRNGKSLEEALKSSYPSSIRSLEELEDRWRKYLSEQ
jgi:hypothetical protein